MDYLAAETYHTRTVEPERRDQKTCRCNGGKFTGLSGAGFSGNQGLDLSSPREGSR